MTKTELIAKAAELGFKLGGETDADKTLAEIIQSRDQSLCESFPLLLANAAEGGKFSFQRASDLLPEADRKYLKLFILVSLGLYDSLGIKFRWRARIFGSFPARLIASFKERIDRNTELELGELKLQPERLRENFARAFKESGLLLRNAARTHGEESLETALAEIFTPRQRELLMKKIRRERFTKTEKEYFSRVVKKKARALANDELHLLARRALA